jgi:glutathione S-transferase|tara:strand:+ start:1414 stop:1980 length:567 start_codon:yes stop_codon:yes gene_type:complete
MYLAEKGIKDVPLVPINILKGESRAAVSLARNPFGGIPYLELDDGTVLSESVAICRYFEALQPDPPLFGVTPLEIATIEMWIRRVELNFMGAVGQVWIHGHPITAKLVEQIPAAAELGRQRTGAFYALFDTHLANNDFVAGKQFSMADILALSVIDFACDLVGVPYEDSLLNVARWRAAISQRPSAAA